MLHVASWTLTPFVLAPSRCAIFPLVQECHKFALAAVQRFAKSKGVTVEEVKVVSEGNEPEAFWDMFELG